MSNFEVKFPEYDGPKKCTWSVGADSSTDPHQHRPIQGKKKIYQNVLERIGETPLISLNKLAVHLGLECELLAKCEFLNPGGSVKDRIALRMVNDAERSGQIKPGDTLIEPTSGNTGIGLAMAAAVKGYKLIITLPEKMSEEKCNIMKLLGAEIIRTPTEAAWNSPDSHIGVALKLEKDLPNAHVLDQYKNPGNPLAHFDTTAEELIEQCDGKIDMICMTAGTGGTLTGIGRKFKEKLPNCKVVAVDPRGSSLAIPDSLNDECRNVPYLVEGIGYDFIPTVLDRSIADEWVKTDDAQAFSMARDLIRLEGLLVGGSSGSALCGAMKAAKNLKKGERCVVILPDSARNYMTKFISDEWMIDQGFMKFDVASIEHPSWLNATVKDLELRHPITVKTTTSCKDVIKLLHKEGVDQMPILDDHNVCVGVVTEGNLTTYMATGRATLEDSVSTVMYKKFKSVTSDCSLAELSLIFKLHPFALVLSRHYVYESADKVVEWHGVDGVVSRIDLLRFSLER